MNRKLSIDIAQSLLFARWRQTLVAAVGVTFSITMFIALLSFMTGLNKMLDGLIINRTPHVRIYNEITQNPQQPITLLPAYKNYHHFISSVKTGNSREALYNNAAIVRVLQDDKRVLGISEKFTTPVFFNAGSARLNGIISGVNVKAENELFHFYDYVTKGNGADLAVVPNSIVLGKALADKLFLEIGDVIFITTATGEIASLKLVALYESGIADLDKVQAYTSLATAQKIMGKPSGYLTDIQVKLHRIEEAPQLAKEYRQLFAVQAEDIQTANAQFDTGTTIRTIISYTVGITLLIVAGFGIYNILNMMIYEKMDTIAILKATGFSGPDVKGIFLLIAITIGFVGGMVGLLFGYIISTIIDAVPFETNALPTIKTFPVNYDPTFYGIGILFSLLTTFFAGWFPAAKAARVDPVVIIRGK